MKRFIGFLATMAILVVCGAVFADGNKVLIERAFTNSITYVLPVSSELAEIMTLEIVFPDGEAECVGGTFVGPSDSQAVISVWTNQLVSTVIFYFPQPYITEPGVTTVTTTNDSDALAVLRIHMKF